MRAPVVPAQPTHGDPRAHELLEHALGVAVERRSIIRDRYRLRRGGYHEEVRRRQLLRVSNDDELTPAGNGADGVLRRKLRRFVEDHDVERGLSARQVLRHRQRAHEEARLDRADRRFRVAQCFPERAVIPLLCHLALKERKRLARACLLQPLLGPFTQASNERPPILDEHLGIEPTELGHTLLVCERVEPGERRPCLHDLGEPHHEERTNERVGENGEEHGPVHRRVQRFGRDSAGYRLTSGLECRPSWARRGVCRQERGTFLHRVEWSGRQVILRPPDDAAHFVQRAEHVGGRVAQRVNGVDVRRRTRGDRNGSWRQPVADDAAAKLHDPLDVGVERVPRGPLALPQRTERVAGPRVRRGQRLALAQQTVDLPQLRGLLEEGRRVRWQPVARPPRADRAPPAVEDCQEPERAFGLSLDVGNVRCVLLVEDAGRERRGRALAQACDLTPALDDAKHVRRRGVPVAADKDALGCPGRAIHDGRDPVRCVDVGGVAKGRQPERRGYLVRPTSDVRDLVRERLREASHDRDVVLGVERLRRVTPRVVRRIPDACCRRRELAQLANRRVERLARDVTHRP